MGLGGEDKAHAAKLQERENLSAKPSNRDFTTYLDTMQSNCIMQ